MGGFSGGSTSSGGGGGNARESYRSSQYSGSSKSKSKSKSTSKSTNKPTNQNNSSNDGNPIINFIKGGGITGAVIRAAVKVGKAVKKDFKTRKTNEALLGSADYQGGKTFSSSTFNNNNGRGRDDNPQGIEFAKASTTSATILGPAEIQKEAANNVKGPTTTEMTAGQILLANKRKGRRSTNITTKKTLANNYTLSKKSLLG